MSYDVMVFDPGAAPRERADFMTWYHDQTQWAEPHGYNDPSVTSPGLRAWYDAMTIEYPNMNGPGEGGRDFDNPKLTDYSIGRSVIYAAFAWSQAEGAYHLVRALAAKHGVGFFDASADEGEIWVPGR